MSADTLRDKIARVLYRLYGPSFGAHPDGWDREPLGTRKMYLDDADAVIRELGMREGVWSSTGLTGPQHRYVTEWEPSID